jgi:hypothetical protein
MKEGRKIPALVKDHRSDTASLHEGKLGEPKVLE